MYNERYRPQYHFSPKNMWMNDPNGLVYHNGAYHLFYQYHPESTVWGPMHWGHAVSKDLMHWEHMPIAISPDALGTIFSGSAVVDTQNTSGLQKDEQPVLLAFYTQHEENNQKQSVAYSYDQGSTWIKYEGNPIIPNNGLTDFRDPKVFWHENNHKWVMALACGDHIAFYGSENLFEWQYLSSFGEDQGCHEGVWECPDLLEIPVEGTQETKWVLFVSINPGAPNGGSGMMYFIGEFDGNRFVSKQTDAKWVDEGKDFYAAVSWSNLPKNQNRIVWIGWMSNWQYANQVPTDPWRSAMTIPRTISLREVEGELLIVQSPVEEMKTIRKEKRDATILSKGAYSPDCSTFELEAIIQGREDWSLSFTYNEEVMLEIGKQNEHFYLDRTYGITNFHDTFQGIYRVPFQPQDETHLRLFIDQSSIEGFLNHGERVVTNLFFPIEGNVMIHWESKGASLREASCYPISGIWK